MVLTSFSFLLRSFPDEYGDVQSNPWSKKTRGKERDSPGGVRSILSEYYICTSVHYSCGDGDHLPQQPPTTMLLLVFACCLKTFSSVITQDLNSFTFFGSSAGTESRAPGIRLQDETHQPAVQVSLQDETSHVCLCLVFVCVNACGTVTRCNFPFNTDTIFFKLQIVQTVSFFIHIRSDMTILMCVVF